MNMPELDQSRRLGYDAIRYVAGWPKSYVREYAAAAVAADRERMRLLFRAALADTGVDWPSEVDILYDQMFAKS